jgi:MraZ protein
VFRGRSTHLIDSKGRVSIPTRFRDLLKTIGDPRLIITNGDQCLTAYTYKAWEEVETKMGQLSLVDRDIRSYKRFLVSGASECSLDRQGRILIPPTLREYAKLDKEVILAGQLKYFEVWDKSRFEADLEKNTNNLPNLEDKLASLGL